MAEALFGAGKPRHYTWARRMLHLFKHKPRGAKRVLHSAATFFRHLGLNKTRAKQFRTACAHLRKRTRWMRYHEYRRRHIPLGSGVTEAACKTVYTQRLKLSGMRWMRSGAQQILELRTILLSCTWQVSYASLLKPHDALIPALYAPKQAFRPEITA